MRIKDVIVGSRGPAAERQSSSSVLVPAGAATEPLFRRHPFCFIAIIVFILSISVYSFSEKVQQSPQKSLKEQVSEKLPLRFVAKRHFQDIEKDLIILEGNVALTYGDTELKAGKVTIDKKKNHLTATDNVHLNIPSEDTFIKGHEISYNYKTRLGEIINGEVKSGYSRLRAEKITKVGDKQYHFYKGTYSTCEVKEGETCPWQIWSYNADVTMGGYATAEHPVFLAGGVPIFYSPFIFFPVKSERQSGFLMPEFGGSDLSGFQLRNSLFLALGRSHDATTSLEYLTKRGFKEGLEYRYMIDSLSSGKLNAYYLQDRAFFKDFGYRDRYVATYDHTLYTTPNFFNKATIKLASDSEYVKDFQKDIIGRQDAGLETKLLQGLTTENFSFNVEGTYYQSLLNSDPRRVDRDIIHRLPEFTASMSQSDYLGLGKMGVPLLFGASFSYVNFYALSGEFKDVNSSGLYDEGTDTLLRAHRTDIFPSFSMPIKVRRYFELVPQLGVRQTHWWLPTGDRNKNRVMLDITPALSTNINRIFNYEGKSVKKIKHLVEPKVTYHYSPFVLLDETIPVFDGLDQLATVHMASWELQNRFIFKNVDSKTSEASYWDGVRLAFNQDYNILTAKSKDSDQHPWSDIKGVLGMAFSNLTVTSESDYNMYKNWVTRISHGMQYSDPWTNVYRLNYVRKRKEPSHTVNGGAGFHFIDILKFNFSLNYDLFNGRFLEKIYQATYFPKSKCWALNFNFEDKRDSGFSFSAGVNVLFGDDFLSLAKLYQQGEQQNLRLFAGQGGRSDL